MATWGRNVRLGSMSIKFVRNLACRFTPDIYNQFLIRNYSRGLKRTPVRVMTVRGEDDKVTAHQHDQDDQQDSFGIGSGWTAEARRSATVSGGKNVPRAPGPGAGARSPGPGARSPGPGAVARSPGQGSQTASDSETATEVPRIRTVAVAERDKVVLPDYVKYEKVGDSDTRCGSLVMLTKTRKGRENKKLTLLEGPNLIQDAIAAGARFKAVFFTMVEHLHSLPLKRLCEEKVPLYKVRMNHMKLWSDLGHPPGIMAVCHIPKPGELPIHKADDEIPVTLICDDIKEPGTLGTLLRTAAAAGCGRTIVTKGCVDIWDPKVLRSAAGAQFRSKILSNVGWELVGNYVDRSSKFYLVDWKGSRDDVDSSKSRLSRRDVDTILSMDDAQLLTKTDEGHLAYEVDESYLKEGDLEVFTKISLSVESCFETSLAEDHSVLIVSGDSAAGTGSAHRMVYEHGGSRLTLPMSAAMRHLNPAVAAGVLLFEIKRQVLARQSQ